MLNKELRENSKSEIGGIKVSLHFDQDLLKEKRKVSPDNHKEQLRLRVHHGYMPEIKEKKKIFDSGETWALCHSGGKYTLQDESLESRSAPDKLITLEPGFKSGDIYIKKGNSRSISIADPLLYPLNQILTIILLSRHKGIMFHACGIKDNERGYLFLGNSTHGKSTMARLWSEDKKTVLNDDRIIVRKQDRNFLMYGTPWHGDFDGFALKTLPVEKIFFLRHGDKNLAIPKKGVEAVSMLITRCFPPIWDKEGMDLTMDLCQRMVKKIPCYELNFIPNEKIIDLVKNI